MSLNWLPSTSGSLPHAFSCRIFPTTLPSWCPCYPQPSLRRWGSETRSHSWWVCSWIGKPGLPAPGFLPKLPHSCCWFQWPIRASLTLGGYHAELSDKDLSPLLCLLSGPFPDLWVEEKVGLRRGPVSAAFWVSAHLLLLHLSAKFLLRLLGRGRYSPPTRWGSNCSRRWAHVAVGPVQPPALLMRDETLEMMSLLVVLHLDQIRLPWDFSLLRAWGQRQGGCPLSVSNLQLWTDNLHFWASLSSAMDIRFPHCMDRCGRAIYLFGAWFKYNQSVFQVEDLKAF